MEKYSRSKSSREPVQQQPSSMYDLRSCSTSSGHNQNMGEFNYNLKEMKGKKGSKSSKSWGLNMMMMDPELQRKKRVAGYKAYAVEGRMKGSFRKSFRWIKDTCNHVVHGIW